MASVEYENVGKSFGPVRVMENISFTIADQRFVVLLGPSGCGKTTLLRMTAGLESIAEGEIRIGGARMNQVHPRDRDIAMVFQNYALYPTLKVYDNIAFSLQVRKHAKEEIRRQVEWAAELLNLTPLSRSLSEGTLRRPASARRHGAGVGPPSPGLPLRRTAVEPGCQAARPDALRDPPPA